MPPPDDHVHTEWSWDATAGSMDRSCARAVALGLPSIAFTEHFDLTRWSAPPGFVSGLPAGASLDASGGLVPPPLDVDGYLDCVQRCRDRYPQLRIVTGVELGEPHWFASQVKTLLAGGAFQRVLGSLHSIRAGDQIWILDGAFGGDRSGMDPDDIVRAYFAEALRMVRADGDFQTLTHIDYPARHWPRHAGPYDLLRYADEQRAVLRALAESGRALEINTRLPLDPTVVGWWHDAGGEAVSFGSDAHRPDAVAHGFAAAAAMAEAHGFRPGRQPHDFWVRGG